MTFLERKGISDPRRGPLQQLLYATKRPTLWPNKWFAHKLADELDRARRLGVRPTKIINPGSIAEIGKGGRIFKWVVSEEGELLGIPKIMPNDVIKHTVPTGGRPVQAAGNARLEGGRLLIDKNSGHYRPDEASLSIAKEQFEAAGYKVEIVASVE
jgi:hypothetical protein